MASKKEKPNAVDPAARRKLLNKLAGGKVVFDLESESPSDVKYWIPTGSTWLDAIICRGQMAGIPGGRIVEFAGLQSVGKSYMALQIAVNAQKMGMTVVYADPEGGMDRDFMRRAGADLSSFFHVYPPDLETWYEIMEEMLKQRAEGERMLFVLDSLAAIPCKSDNEGDYNPNSSVGVKARIQSKSLMKLMMPLQHADATYIILNQLKTNISGLSQVANPKYATDSQRYSVPGGKAAEYAASLRIWLTGSVSKKLIVTDKQGYRVGSYVKARLEKSRFGSQGRICEFKILWGERIGVKDEESILEAVKGAPEVKLGAWNSLKMENGYEKKWQGIDKFEDMMQTDEEFRGHIMSLLMRDVVLAFENKTIDAKQFYDLTSEELERLDKEAKAAAAELKKDSET